MFARASLTLSTTLLIAGSSAATSRAQRSTPGTSARAAIRLTAACPVEGRWRTARKRTSPVWKRGMVGRPARRVGEGARLRDDPVRQLRGEPALRQVEALVELSAAMEAEPGRPVRAPPERRIPSCCGSERPRATARTARPRGRASPPMRASVSSTWRVFQATWTG
jgi:hypothetical protein